MDVLGERTENCLVVLRSGSLAKRVRDMVDCCFWRVVMRRNVPAVAKVFVGYGQRKLFSVQLSHKQLESSCHAPMTGF